LRKARQDGRVSLDVSDCPDLVPALALRAALRDGETTHIVNAARLRLKESDRLSSVTDVLDRLGARIREKPDGLDITGVAGFAGGVRVSAHSDHRIAMTLAVAATRCERAITIEGAECVAKSYPDFWKDMEKLGLAFGERRETEK
jgi:3-phosphoshikimate 1-carboxyvinyltransferase